MTPKRRAEAPFIYSPFCGAPVCFSTLDLLFLAKFFFSIMQQLSALFLFFSSGDQAAINRGAFACPLNNNGGCMRTKARMISKSFFCIHVLAIVFLATAFTVGGAYAQEAKYNLKLATLAPKGIGWAMEWENTLKPGIIKAAHDEIAFKTYYGGIMGDEEDYIKKMRIGQLDAGAITGQGAVMACPELTVVELPFLFNNYDEVDFVRDKMYPVFDSYAQDHGFKLVYWFEQDFDQCYSMKYSLETIKDFQKARFVAWYGPLEKKFLDSLGASPVPVNGPEVPSALRQGIVDAVIAPSVWVVGSQTYTLFTHVNTLKVRYAPGLLVIASKTWDQLPPGHQKRIEATRSTSLRDFISNTRDANAKSLQAILKYGVKESQMSPAVREELKKRAMTSWDEASGEDFPEDVLDQIVELLEEFREGRS